MLREACLGCCLGMLDPVNGDRVLSKDCVHANSVLDPFPQVVVIVTIPALTQFMENPEDLGLGEPIDCLYGLGKATDAMVVANGPQRSQLLVLGTLESLAGDVGIRNACSIVVVPSTCKQNSGRSTESVVLTPQCCGRGLLRSCGGRTCSWWGSLCCWSSCCRRS